MKIARMIGLALIAALAMMAVAGASSASANQTTLCKSNSLSYCPESERYASGTTFKASSSSVKITEKTATIECAESTIEGKTTAASGEPLKGEVTAWTLGKCTRKGTSCTAEPLKKRFPASATIARSVLGNGTMSVTKNKEAKEALALAWTFACGGEIECDFRFEPTITLTGGNPAVLGMSKLPMKGEGGLCQDTAPTFTANYTVSSPQPLYVKATEAPTKPKGYVFCAGIEYPCAIGNNYPSGTEFAAELVPGTEAEFHIVNGSWKCKKSSFSGKTTAESGASALPASISSFAFDECSAPLIGSCTWSAENLPYSTAFSGLPGKEQVMSVSKFRQHFACGGLNCAVASELLEFTFSGGSPAAVEVWQEVRAEGSACPTTAYIFKAKYQFSKPSLLALAYNE